MLIDLNKDAWKLEDVYSKLGAEEILCQLCEECGELIKAANKVRRAMKGTTPVSLDDAKTNLIEECADVLMRDPVKVVYCKDWKDLYFKDFSAFCPHRVGACRPDGFCEYGERRNP